MFLKGLNGFKNVRSGEDSHPSRNNISLYGRFKFTSIHTPVSKACKWNTTLRTTSISQMSTMKWAMLITDLG